jgi:hypothetical protein
MVSRWCIVSQSQHVVVDPQLQNVMTAPQHVSGGTEDALPLLVVSVVVIPMR